jgi:hypothetical protein
MDVNKNAKRLLGLGIFAIALCASMAAAIAAPVTGAIFTTLYDGSAVDYNIHDAKQDVYLNGGWRQR